MKVTVKERKQAPSAPTIARCTSVETIQFCPLLLSVVIPAKDEASALSSLIPSVKRSVAAYPHEILVVDDGSTDATCAVACRHGISVVSHPTNMGKGAAMRTGVSNTRGNIIVFIDADGAHDASDIPAVVAPIVRGEADFVIGSRCLPQSRVVVSPAVRKLTNHLASLTITALVTVLLPMASLFRCHVPHVRITDCTSGFRAIRREAWHRMELSSQGFEIEAEMIYEAARSRLSIAEAPIGCDWNAEFSHLSIFGDGVKTAMLLVWKLMREVGGRPTPPHPPGGNDPLITRYPRNARRMHR